jgi:hypothetical protein
MPRPAKAGATMITTGSPPGALLGGGAVASRAPCLRGDKLSSMVWRCLLRGVHIFRGGMLVFMQHTGVVERLFMGMRPPAVAAVRDSQQQRMAPIP